MAAKLVKSLGRRAGIEIGRYRPAAARRVRLMSERGIATVLDVGASTGQYAGELRAYGYSRRIVSFEPVREPFSMLEERAAPDSRWDIHNVALGEREGDAAMNVASNLASSSLLDMRSEHLAGAPAVSMVGTERVQVRKLDSLSLALDPPVLLKLDVQGYEDRVLAGASRTLADVVLVDCELSLAHLYDGQPSFRRMIDLLGDLGFEILDLDPFFYDRTDGRVLAVAAVFERPSSLTV